VENLYITAAGHYARIMLIHLTVHVEPRGSAASSSVACFALRRWPCQTPLFQIMQFAPGVFKPTRFVLTGAGVNLEVEYLGTSESEGKGRLAEVLSHGHQTLASKFNSLTGNIGVRLQVSFSTSGIRSLCARSACSCAL
jgi:hypothetical protein